MNTSWNGVLLLINEYAMQVTDAANHEAASRSDVSQSAALKTLTKLRELWEAAPQQEPVAVVQTLGNGVAYGVLKVPLDDGAKLYAAPQPVSADVVEALRKARSLLPDVYMLDPVRVGPLASAIDAALAAAEAAEATR